MNKQMGILNAKNKKKRRKTQLGKVINVPCVSVHTLAVKLSFIGH